MSCGCFALWTTEAPAMQKMMDFSLCGCWKSTLNGESNCCFWFWRTWTKNFMSNINYLDDKKKSCLTSTIISEKESVLVKMTTAVKGEENYSTWQTLNLFILICERDNPQSAYFSDSWHLALILQSLVTIWLWVTGWVSCACNQIQIQAT